MKNITKPEKSYLVEQKLREGKDEYQAREEIERDVKYIKELNQTEKDLKKEIKELEKQQNKTKLKFDKEFKKLTKIKQKKSPNNQRTLCASTRHLKRILNYLSEVNKAGVTEIKEINLLCSAQVNDGLRFLINLGKVEKLNERNSVYYKLI